MADVKKPAVISKIEAPIQGIHFFGKMREKLKEFFPKHLDSEYYLLDRYTLSVASGHITSIECVLKKNPDVEEDPFYQKELTPKLSGDQVKAIQAAMDEIIIALIGSEVHISSNGTKPEITWAQGTYVSDDMSNIAVTFVSKIEIDFKA